MTLSSNLLMTAGMPPGYGERQMWICEHRQCVHSLCLGTKELAHNTENKVRNNSIDQIIVTTQD